MLVPSQKLSPHQHVGGTLEPLHLLVCTTEEFFLGLDILDAVDLPRLQLPAKLDCLRDPGIKKLKEERIILALAVEIELSQLIEVVNADERIAAADGMVEELEWFIFGECKEPQA